MRLTSLARKIKIAPSKLIAFLKQNEIEIDNGINTKLDDQTISKAMEYFGFEDVKVEAEPDLREKETIIVDEAAEDPVVELVEEKKDIQETRPLDLEIHSPEEETSKEEEIKAENPVTPKTGTIDDLEEGLAEDIELIKVKKVKLEGIKVVGKIELPEKPKKAEPQDDEASSEDENEEKKTKAEQRKRHQKQGNKEAQKGKRSGLTISYEEKLRREEKLKRRQIKLKLNEEKVRKREHYVKSVQTKTVSSVPGKKKKKQNQQEYTRKQQVVVHKNPILRFWAWLNGKYDKF